MTTPTYLTGVEHGMTPTGQGGGLFDVTSSSQAGLSADSTIKRSGDYSLKVTSPGSGTAYHCRKNFASPPQIAVQTFHFYVPTGGVPNANNIFAGFSFTTNGGTAGLHINTTGIVKAQVSGGATVGTTSLVLDAWHRIDYRLNITTSTWILEWYLDGVQQPDATWAGQSTTDSIASVRYGSTSGTVAYTIYFDDMMASVTSGDYPIGDFAVERLSPNADGTHNAGTNIIEDNTGVDIGVTTAYDKLNSVPANGSTYIKQVNNGTGNYAEVLFSNMQSSYSSIIGAMGLLAFTSETSALNKGATIFSKDGFSTNTPIWGSPGATVDYSEGTLSSLYWKSAIIAGAVDTSTVNSISARIGYSDDTAPDPYWVDLFVEVAYVPGSSDTISLDLVTYTSTANDIIVVESEPISLDLVSYTSTFNAVNLVESEPINLDLATHTSTFNDITVVESEPISLDLVTYTSSFNAASMIESEPISLDLVSYVNTFNAVNVIESEPISLDLVTYTSAFNSITIVEGEIISLELVEQTSTINDLTIVEDEIVLLDLVSYSSVVNDVSFIENSSDTYLLDVVLYNNTVNDLVVIEHEPIGLDLIAYSSIVNEVAVIEHEPIALDLAVYSSVINDMLVIEQDTIVLDLVSFTYSVLNLTVLEGQIIKTPLGRCYLVHYENRSYLTLSEERSILISQ